MKKLLLKKSTILIFGGLVFLFCANASFASSPPPAINYAPNLWFDSEEQYYPANPLDFYFEKNLEEIPGEIAKTKYENLSLEEKLKYFTVFYRIIDEGNEWVYQYWFFYVFNNSNYSYGDYLFGNDHYGDFESVYVFVNKYTQNVNRIVGSAHNGTELNWWSFPLSKALDIKELEFCNNEIIYPNSRHIRVLVEKGGHPNYLDGDNNGLVNPKDDLTSGSSFYTILTSLVWSEEDKLHGTKVEYNDKIYNLIPLSEFSDKFIAKYGIERKLFDKSPTLGSFIRKFNERKQYFTKIGGHVTRAPWDKTKTVYYDSDQILPLSSSIKKKTKELTMFLVGAWRYLENFTVDTINNIGHKIKNSLLSFGSQVFNSFSKVEPEYMGTMGVLNSDIIDDILGENNATRREITEKPITNNLLEDRSLGKLSERIPKNSNFLQDNIFIVKEVIDGDTIILENGQKIRYIGINAPEMPNGCFAQEATDKNKELVEGKKVRLEKDISEIDSYGRLLRYAYLIEEDSEIFINEDLIKNGYAYDWAYGPDTKYKKDFAEAEEEARINRKGIWGDVCHLVIEEKKEDKHIVIQDNKTGGTGGISSQTNEAGQDQSQIDNNSEQEQQEDSGNSEEGQGETSEENQQESQSNQEELVEYKAKKGDIIINEIAWMGTVSSSYDEWIELYNKTDYDINLAGWILEAEDGAPIIELSATVSANNFFLLERTDEDTVFNINADQIYTGALGNEGEILRLKNIDGQVIDELNCSNGWHAGDNETKRTMERSNFKEEGTNPGNWHTYSGSGSDALDIGGYLILGTPKLENSEENYNNNSDSEGSNDNEQNENEDSGGNQGEENTEENIEEDSLYTAITENIKQNTTWTLNNSPYLVYDNNGENKELLEIAENVTLTIESGVIIKFVNPGLKIHGTIKAEGTKEQKIIFTDYNDKEYAGEFCGNSVDSKAGAWSGIYFTEKSKNSILDNVIIRYAGSRTRPFRTGSSYSPISIGAALKVEDTSIIITNSTIENNLFKGVWLINSSDSVIKNTVFKGNKEYDSLSQWNDDYLRNISVYVDSSNPNIFDSVFQDNITSIYMINGSQPIIKNNQFLDNLYSIWVKNSYPEFSNNQMRNNNWNGIVLQKIKIDRDYILGADSPFINYDYPFNSIIIPQGYTLTIKPGTIIKSVYNTSGLEIAGTLIADGTANKPIIFTSIYDDKYGGDTNKDGDESINNLKPGVWGQLKFTSSSTDSYLNHVVLRFGGVKWMQAPIHFKEDYVLNVDMAEITIANSVIENNTGGCQLENSNSQIISTTFKNHQYSKPFSGFTSTGIKLVSSNAFIDSSTFLNNNLGLYISPDSVPTLTNLVFENNIDDVEDLRPEEEGEPAENPEDNQAGQSTCENCDGEEENGFVEIIDIFYDGEEENEPDEYVEIKNNSDETVDLEYWTLTDEAEHIYTFPFHNLQPGESVRVYTNMGDFSYGSNTAIWNNDGDTAYLKNREGDLIDNYSY